MALYLSWAGFDFATSGSRVSGIVSEFLATGANTKIQAIKDALAAVKEKLAILDSIIHTAETEASNSLLLKLITIEKADYKRLKYLTMGFDGCGEAKQENASSTLSPKLKKIKDVFKNGKHVTFGNIKKEILSLNEVPDSVYADMLMTPIIKRMKDTVNNFETNYAGLLDEEKKTVKTVSQTKALKDLVAQLRLCKKDVDYAQNHTPDDTFVRNANSIWLTAKTAQDQYLTAERKAKAEKKALDEAAKKAAEELKAAEKEEAAD